MSLATFLVLTAVAMKSTAFWDKMLYNLAQVQLYETTQCHISEDSTHQCAT